MGQFVTGVCAVSTLIRADPAQHDAIAVNSFTSVSLEPPLVSMCLRRDSTFLARTLASGVWAASILAGGSERLVRMLTAPAAERSPAETIAAWSAGSRTGCLILPDGPGSVECEVHSTLALGDHVLVVGRVLGLTHQDVTPLVFHRGVFTGVVAAGGRVRDGASSRRPGYVNHNPGEEI
jgi:flavin reductase